MSDPRRDPPPETRSACGLRVWHTYCCCLPLSCAPLARFILLLLLPMSACIIPVGPDFQDPPAAPNYAPYIISANPDFFSIVATQSPTFEVTVTDPNGGD